MPPTVRIHDKKGGLTGILGPLTSAKGFPDNALIIPATATKMVPFSSGGTTEIVAGNIVTGATSTKTAYVVATALFNGTWAGGDASGVLFLKDPSGTFQAENLDVGATSNLATIPSALLSTTGFAGRSALAALITPKSYAVNYTVTPESPTVTAGTDLGVYLDTGFYHIIEGLDDVKNFKAINAVASSGAVIRFTLFY